MRCAECGAPKRAEARFCDQCGVRLGDGDDRAADWVAGEQRHVTVMFCDLVESTAHAQRLDLEDWRDVVRAFQAICFREISRLGGFVAQYLGDGVLAYFGYPVAREQDAQAAVRAGLEIVHAQAQRAQAPGQRAAADAPLPVRVGLHTGLVLAGEMGLGGGRQRLAVGTVPAVAARVQATARPNSVVISDATYNLVHEFFDCRRLDPQAVRGLEHPPALYEVVGATDAQSRPQGALGTALTPLVGREHEVEALLAGWRRACDGAGQVVLIAGDAGMGKSRLVRELQSRLREEPHATFECRGAPQHEGDALYPIAEGIRRAWGLGRAETETEVESEAVVARALRPFADRHPHAMPLMQALLGLPVAPGAEPWPGNPARRKRQTLSLLSDLLFALTEQQSVLFVVEDLHWIDPSTLELLGLIADRISSATRILAVFLFRPSFEPPWRAGPHVSRLDLSRLDPDQSRAVVRHLGGGKALPADVTREIARKADGIPLYLEEVTRMVLESGALEDRGDRYEATGRAAAVAIPATLQESLIARLDRLGPLRDLVQLAAVIGRVFELELIWAASGADEQLLRAQLARLSQLDMLRVRGAPPDEQYVFRHALIQEAAYASLLRSRRREHHRRIAEALEGRLSARGLREPDLLAHHWAGAERYEAAIPYFLSAGQRAAARSAYLEAAGHVRRGLALVQELPAGEGRDRAELELQLALGPVLVATLGYANPEVERVYTRARDLAAGLHDQRRLYVALSGQHIFHQSRAAFSRCDELNVLRQALATELADPTLQMHVLETAGTVAFWRGDHERALALLRDALARHDEEGARLLRMIYGTDSAVIATAYEAQSLWYLGHPDQARDRAAAAVERGRAIGDDHSLILALVFAGILHLARGEVAEARDLTDQAIARSAEQHLQQWLGTGLFVRGLVLVRLGEAEAGFAAMQEGGEVYRGAGALVGARFFAAGLAEAYLGVGKAADGLAFLAAAQTLFEGGEDAFHDAELERVAGALLAATGDTGAALERLDRALALARRQKARSLELRAATSRAALMAARGQRAEAISLLAPVRGWFTEGAATADLRAADALLTSLAAPAPG